MAIYPRRHDEGDDEVAELTAAGWEASPLGAGWWRDPQTRRDYPTHRAIELARRDREGVRCG